MTSATAELLRAVTRERYWGIPVAEQWAKPNPLPPPPKRPRRPPVPPPPPELEEPPAVTQTLNPVDREILELFADNYPVHEIAGTLDPPQLVSDVRRTLEQLCHFDLGAAKELLRDSTDPQATDPVDLTAATPVPAPHTSPSDPARHASELDPSAPPDSNVAAQGQAAGGPLVDPIVMPDPAPRESPVPGLTYRRLDYWTTRGWIHADNPSPGSGKHRHWPPEELDIAARMLRLADVEGLALAKAAEAARAELKQAAAARIEWAPTPPAVVPVDAPRIQMHPDTYLELVDSLNGATVVSKDAAWACLDDHGCGTQFPRPLCDCGSELSPVTVLVLRRKED